MLVLVIGDLHIPVRAHDLPAKFKKLLVPGKIQQVLLTGNVCDGETLEWLRSICNGDVRAVRGDWDEVRLGQDLYKGAAKGDVANAVSLQLPSAPPSQVITHGPLRIGLIHGHQVVPLGDTESLSAIARKLDVDILISGSTHKFEAFEYEGRFFINPGSATGAFTFSNLGGTTSLLKPRDEDNSSNGADASNGDASKAQNGGSPAAESIASFALMDLQGSNVVTYVYQLIEGDVRVERVEFRKD